MMPSEDLEATVPLVEEDLRVGKRIVETDRVRISTLVDERDVVLEANVERGELHVERRAVDREVVEPPPPREEDDCLVVSIVEERAVIEKRLFVVEEVLIRRRAHDETVQLPTTVRATRAVIEHLPTAAIDQETRND